MEENNEMIQDLNLDDIGCCNNGFNLGDIDSCDNEPNYIKEKIIDIDTDSLSKVSINKEKFKDGVNAVSYLCGAITALTNVGITPDKAMDYIVDKEATEIALKHNIEMANIQKDTSVETAKVSLLNSNPQF